MSEQDILDHLDRWSRDFEARLRKAGRPVHKSHETSQSYKRADKKDDAFTQREKLKND